MSTSTNDPKLARVTPARRRRPVREKLKPDRVQEPLDVRQRIAAQRVRERLPALPGWRLVEGNRALDRVRELPDATAAAGYVSFVAMLAAAMDQPVGISLAGHRVVLTLHGHPRRGTGGGLTEAVLDFAASLG